MHWPPMNKFACKLHGYIVYFGIDFALGIIAMHNEHIFSLTLTLYVSTITISKSQSHNGRQNLIVNICALYE